MNELVKMPKVFHPPHEMVGYRVFLIRAAFGKGANQEAFAHHMGWTKNAQNNYETGFRRPGREACRKFWQRYKVSEEWILFGDESGMNLGALEPLWEAAKSHPFPKADPKAG